MSFRLENKGILFVLSAPSGGGKSTVRSRLMKEDSRLAFSVSVTTRPPREGEVDGADYYFRDKEYFQTLINEKRFYEWAFVHKNMYGTTREEVQRHLNSGRDIMLELDTEGGLNIKRLKPTAVLIYILPPSLDVLENRLRTRATDHEEVIQTRLDNAMREISHAPQYDYTLVNEDLDRCIQSIKCIIEAERLACRNQKILL